MLKQVFLINTDLKMTCGKICAQVAHAETLYMESVMMDYADIKHQYDAFTDRYFAWKDNSVKPIGLMKKIVLEATEQQIKDIILILAMDNIQHYIVYDLGLTQLKNGSLSCLCTEPIEEEISNKLFKHLKLL